MSDSTMKGLVYLFLLECHPMLLYVVCFVPTDEQKLFDRLLTGYNSASRPVYNASDIVTVKFGITLTQVSDMVRITCVVTIFISCVYIYKVALQNSHPISEQKRKNKTKAPSKREGSVLKQSMMD